jgi:hypothetical protein
MHGSPVRVVAVTNVDPKIMSRRTPTDRVLGRRRFAEGIGVRERRKVLPEWDCESCDPAGAEIR